MTRNVDFCVEASFSNLLLIFYCCQYSFPTSKSNFFSKTNAFVVFKSIHFDIQTRLMENKSPSLILDHHARSNYSSFQFMLSFPSFQKNKFFYHLPLNKKNENVVIHFELTCLLRPYFICMTSSFISLSILFFV